MVVGMYLSIKLPKIYQAKTLILVMPQRVPTNFVRSIVTTSLGSRISTISEEILSRSNLEKIIEKYGLFSDPKYSGMFLEEMVDALRKRIEVKVNRGRQGSDSFSISFRGAHPKMVMEVTNRLTGSFIDENLKVREAQAVGTSEFLADELKIKRQRLEEVEQKLKEYRHQYMGELPEQLDANLRILERLQTQLSEREKTLRDEKSRLTVIENQIEGNRKILTENRVTGTVSDEGDEVSLELLKAQLTTLKSNYTDRHPDVIKLKAKIADLEAGYKAVEPVSSGEPRANVAGDPALQLVSNTLTELMRQRVELSGEIQNITLEITELKQQLKEYQQRVERTPQREQELLAFNRDYDNIQGSYNSLLNRKLEAEIAVNMEKKQKGEQFLIVDRAALPRKPVSPDMRKLFLLSAAAGLGLGAGLIFLLEFLDTSLKQPKDYESELGLAVLATIPKILDRRDKVFIRVNQGLTLFSLIIAVALAAGFATLVFIGVEPTIELVREFAKL
jgi:polysaccharide chain length determinant protein (PEP-CTERM system associated)